MYTIGPEIQAYCCGAPAITAKAKGIKRKAEFFAVFAKPVKKLYLIGIGFIVIYVYTLFAVYGLQSHFICVTIEKSCGDI